MARTIGTDCYCYCCGNGECDGHETHTGRVTCPGCFNKVRPQTPTDHSRGCPTGQNGTPNYN